MTARPLDSTAAALLGLLHDGPLSGWELVGRAQVRIGDFWTPTQSQVHRELTVMAAVGHAGLQRATARLVAPRPRGLPVLAVPERG